jgi:hypothetical protein
MQNLPSGVIADGVLHYAARLSWVDVDNVAEVAVSTSVSRIACRQTYRLGYDAKILVR